MKHITAIGNYRLPAKEERNSRKGERAREEKRRTEGRASTTTAAECICLPFPWVSTLKACRRNRHRGYPISRRDLSGKIFAARTACARRNAFTRSCLRVNLVKGFPWIKGKRERERERGQTCEWKRNERAEPIGYLSRYFGICITISQEVSWAS